MPRSFKGFAWRLPGGAVRDPKFVTRLVLGALLVLNLAAFWMVLSPPGGSVTGLEAQIASQRSNLAQRKAGLERTKAMAARLEQARAGKQQFQKRFFTDRRVASSTFVAELSRAAKDAGIRPKEHVFLFEPVEGSDTISMMTINANYEGTYADLRQFIHKLDQSERFLILDSLGAAPQQGTGLLNIVVKLNAFVEEAGS
jgi:type IV pilus assembly protein PilO